MGGANISDYDTCTKKSLTANHHIHIETDNTFWIWLAAPISPIHETEHWVMDIILMAKGLILWICAAFFIQKILSVLYKLFALFRRQTSCKECALNFFHYINKNTFFHVLKINVAIIEQLTKIWRPKSLNII